MSLLVHIFIYNKMFKNHCSYIHKVLEGLLKAKKQTDINKCKFYIQEIKFFDLIISIKIIQIDL